MLRARSRFASRGTGYSDEGPDGLEYNPFTHTWSLVTEPHESNRPRPASHVERLQGVYPSTRVSHLFGIRLPPAHGPLMQSSLVCPWLCDMRAPWVCDGRE